MKLVEKSWFAPKFLVFNLIKASLFVFHIIHDFINNDLRQLDLFRNISHRPSVVS